MQEVTFQINDQNPTFMAAATKILEPVEGANMFEKFKKYMKDKFIGEVNAFITREAQEAVTPTLIEDTEIS